MKISALLELGKNLVTCDFDVWEQAWKPDGRSVKANCTNEKNYSFTQTPVSQRGKLRTRRDTVGGQSEVDKDDETVLNLLTTHLKRLDTGSEDSIELVSIEKVTKQVVAGLKYNVNGTFRVGKNELKDCSIDIWTRTWIEGDEGTQIKAECNGGVRLKTKRTKRSIRPMPGRHDKFHSKETTDMKARELKSEVLFEHFVKKYQVRRIIKQLLSFCEQIYLFSENMLMILSIKCALEFSRRIFTRSTC